MDKAEKTWIKYNSKLSGILVFVNSFRKEITNDQENSKRTIIIF